MPKKTKSFIEVFEPIFEKLEFKHPGNTAGYYVSLIEDFPTNFDSIKRSLRKISNQMTGGNLKISRQQLLNEGFMAHIIDADVPKAEYFGFESYLPVNPKIVWELNKELIEPLYEEGDLNRKEELVDTFEDIYKKNFGDYGIGNKNKDSNKDVVVTVRYEKPWVLYMLINNAVGGSTISMMLSGLGSFSKEKRTPTNPGAPIIPFYNYHKLMMVKKVDKIKVMYQRAGVGGEKEIEKNIENAKRLDDVEIRKIELDSVTSRRILINDRVSIDGRKILKFLGRTLPDDRTVDHLSYIATIYLQKEVIEQISAYFDYLWKQGTVM